MKKIIKITLIVVVILFVCLISIPFLFKDKIISAVNDEINSNVNAKVAFSDVDITIFSSFPNLTLKINNLLVTLNEPFASDTLLTMQQAAVTLDIMSVIKGDQIKISGITLDHPDIRLLVLENGQANWDIAKPSEDTTTTTSEPSTFDIGLNHYEILNGHISYIDRSLGFSTELIDLNHQGKGDFTSDLFTLKTQTDAKAITLVYGGVPYIYNAKTKIDADFEMDMAHSKYSFINNHIVLNELALGVDGFVAMPGNDIEMDLKWEVKENSFKTFMSMIPGVYREGFDNVKSSGRLAMDGTLKGVYNDNRMPGFTLNLQITNGEFQYPDLPTALKNVQVDLKINNPDGVPDNTIINLSKFHTEMGDAPFDARLLVKTPVSDADIDANLKGAVNLATISQFVPLEEGTKLAGSVLADVSAKGKMSAIDQKKYDQFNASGSIKMKDIAYASKEFPQGMSIPVCELIFNPKNVTLNSFEMQFGKSDFKANGWVDNLFGYMLKENQLLAGTLDVRSNVVDINEMMGNQESASTAADSTPSGVVQVPENIDFVTTVEIGKLYYDNLILENVKGNVSVRDRMLGINGVSFDMLEGQAIMNGLYHTKDPVHPEFFFGMTLKQFDIKKTYDAFISVQKLAPVAERCKGKFSTELKVRGLLDQNMEADLNTLTGGGKLTTSNVVVENFPPLYKLAETLKMDQFKSVDVSNLNISYAFENGRVNLAPFDWNIAGIKTTTSGSSGFDQSIDYNMNMKIPTSMMGSEANNAINNLLSQANDAGANLSMAKEIPVTAKFGGTYQQPTVKTDLSKAAGSMANDLKEQARLELEKKKKEMEEQAKAEIERLKKEAEDKAKAEADRLKKEAEAKAKAEIEKQKKAAEEQLKKQAEDKLKGIFNKPK